MYTHISHTPTNQHHKPKQQIESGAQVIQVFDSWAGHLSPLDYDVFAAPYQRRVIEKIKAKHPEVPIIIYINKVRFLDGFGWW